MPTLEAKLAAAERERDEAVARERQRCERDVIKAYNDLKFSGRRDQFDEADIRDAIRKPAPTE